MKEIKDWVKQLPDRKKYIDVITAIMSVPILLTVMVTNISNLSSKKDANAAVHVENKPSPAISEVIKVVPIEIHDDTASTSKEAMNVTNSPTPTEAVKNTTPTNTPTASPACKKEVGPVSIVSPSENETVIKNPICIDILYKTGEYCGASWTYRVDGGSWSEYLDKSICIQNMTNGNHRLELKVKSISSEDEELLIRNFTYTGQSQATATPTITPEPTNVSTSSATIPNN